MSSDRKDHEMKHVFSRADHQTNTENICEKPNMKRVIKTITRKNIKSTESYLKDLKLKKKLSNILQYVGNSETPSHIRLNNHRKEKGYEKSSCYQGIVNILTAGTTSSISMENTN